MLPMSDPSYVGFLKKGAGVPRTIPNTRLAFERGTAELLLGPPWRVRDLCETVNYGCRHCFKVVENSNAVLGIEKAVKGPRAMSFNGLRSHVKEK